MKRFLPLLACLLQVVVAAPVFADTAGTADQSFSIRFENDSFGKTDENYTNGISLAWTFAGDGLAGWAWDLFGTPAGKRFTTLELSQLQFTPSDLSRSDPDPDDRPYAGVLYGGVATHLQREESLHTLKLLAGVVGPASNSEGVQKATHRVLGYRLPKGWNHQVKNEPIINLLYEYRHRYTLTPEGSAIGIQFIPRGELFLGNFLTQAGVALQARIGYHLPADFGATVLRGAGYLPPPDQAQQAYRWGVYAYAGSSANLVAWNITLDGNTVAESQRVHKRLFLPTNELGMSIWTAWFQTTFSYVILEREFDTQPRRENYGAVLFTIPF